MKSPSKPKVLIRRHIYPTSWPSSSTSGRTFVRASSPSWCSGSPPGEPCAAVHHSHQQGHGPSVVHRFCPLSYEEADKAWSYLFTLRKIAFARKQFLLSRLMNLSARSFIVLAGALNGKPAQIYPWSSYQVMQRAHAAPSQGERLQRWSQKNLPDVAQRFFGSLF